MDGPHLTEALDALSRCEAELRERRQEVAALNTELEQTNQGLIALYAELEAARQSETQLAAIVHSSDDAMFSMTPQGTIQTWNPGAERLSGHPTAEIVGRPTTTLLAGAAHDELDRTLKLIRAGGRAKPYDTRVRRADGTLVDVAVTVSAIRDRGDTLIGFSVVIRDITDRLRMETELAAARADREVMADRDRIARDLHDMVIQRVFAAGLALQTTAALVKQPQAATRLRTVIGELDATIDELRTAIFDLHQPPRQATPLRVLLLDLTGNAAEGLGFTPTVDFDGPIDTAVPDDIAVHLLAVVREALSNIARHARASTAQVTVSAGTELLLQVTDDGRGLDNPTRTSGLSNMRDRAESLGGTFEVTGRPGAGTRLEWRVPLP